MSDLIRRKDVIRSLQSMMQDCFPEAEEELDAVVTTVREIPSAEEEEVFEWCHDCKEYDQEKHCCHRWTKVIRQTIEEMKAESERKKGEWRHLVGNEWCCTNCGYVVSTGVSWEHPKEQGKDYCEHCGADMRGEQNER